MQRALTLLLALLWNPAMMLPTTVGAQVAGTVDVSSGLERALASARLETPEWNEFQLGIAMRYLTNWSAIGARATETGSEARLHRRFGVGGAWLGTRDFRGLGGGIWRAVGNVVVSIAAHDRSARVVGDGLRFVSVPVLDSSFTDSGWVVYQTGKMLPEQNRTTQTRRWSEFEARIDWAPWGPGRLEIGASVVGGRLPWGPRSDSLSRASRSWWGRATLMQPIASRVALLATAGADPAIRNAEKHTGFFTVGLRWIPGSFREPRLPSDAPGMPVRRVAFSVRPDSGGMHTIALRIEDARRVEIAGDFSHWSPLVMKHADGVWRLTLRLAPGPHRVNIRIDGGKWVAPPDLPVVDDEFNGRVGLFVVR